MIARICLLALISLITMSAGFAQTGPSVPDSISFQGFATYTDGTPIDGPLDITTKLYSDGSNIFTQVHSGVSIDNGLFNLIIGPLDQLTFNQPIEVGVTLGLGTELSPRTPLLSVPFALGLRGLHAFEVINDGNETFNLIGGGITNFVPEGVAGATISGGGGVHANVPAPNNVSGHFGTVAGGYSNTVGGSTGTVSGGHSNTANGDNATIGGGVSNSAAGTIATIGGGTSNTTNSTYATIGGGQANFGGGTGAVIAGGQNNGTSGSGASIGGGSTNVASGDYATVPGGDSNSARGYASFAAGYKARAKDNGTFVWNDRSMTSGNDSLVSTAANQFLVRAAGGFGIGTASPKPGLTISRDVEAAAYQLELRNVGDIHGGNFSGIAFTQTSTGATESAAIKVIYHSDGRPDMSFSVRDAADALFIESTTGSIGIGTTSPTVALEVNGEIKAPTITETSDERMKRDVAPIHDALLLVAGLQGVSFDWDREAWPDRNFGTGRQIGLIAQDVEQVVPEVVRHDDDGYYSLAYSKLVPLLIEAVKEQQALIVAQNERIAALEQWMRP